ncbi:MAG: RNA methyltransferase [Planctomycetes bacterium]|nr:RNA methyltransferase [Planctomycetota bacterium]
MMQEFYASAIRQTEGALCDELREYGFKSVRLNRGGIPFRGEWSEGWRACLQSRIAQRILVLMGRSPVTTADQLYDATRAIDWTPYLTSEQTLSVSCVAVGSTLTHSGFIALRVKDALVDQVRDLEGDRPSIDKDDPDVRVFVYLANDKASFYLDMSGQPLHMRGYRARSGEAPLRESLAAAILRMSGWDRQSALIDPMCGSGTLAIEAALWASGMAPGLARDRFGFERWASHGEKDALEVRALRGALRAEVTGQKPAIVAADIDSGVLDIARANAKIAGIKLAIREQSVLNLQADGVARTLVTNPPYGRRLETEPSFPDRLGVVIRRLHGWRVAILSGNDAYEKAIQLTPKHKIPLVNGDVDCHLLIYEVE